MNYYVIIIVIFIIFTLLAFYVFHGIRTRIRAYQLRFEQFLKGLKVDFLFGKFKDVSVSKTTTANGVDCRSQWNKLRTCLRNRHDDHSEQKLFSLPQLDNLLRELTSCYASQGCKSPFPSQNERTVQRNCFRETKQKLDRELMSCIRGQYPDFDNTAGDEEPDFLLAQHKNELNLADQNGDLCPPQADRSSIDQCVLTKVDRVVKNSPEVHSSYCQVLQSCQQQFTGNSADCSQRWQFANNDICNCLNRLNLDDYSQNYRQCLETKNNYSFKPDVDIFPQWLQKLRDKMCHQNAGCSVDGFVGPEITENSRTFPRVPSFIRGNGWSPHVPSFIRGNGWSGPQTPGAGFIGPQIPGAGFTGPQTPGAGFTGPQTPDAGFTGPQTPGAGFTGNNWSAGRNFFAGGNGGDPNIWSNFNAGAAELARHFGPGNIDLSNLFGNFGRKK